MHICEPPTDVSVEKLQDAAKAEDAWVQSAKLSWKEYRRTIHESTKRSSSKKRGREQAEEPGHDGQ
jgi:hypothetical protein